jgi:hypothetical protein
MIEARIVEVNTEDSRDLEDRLHNIFLGRCKQHVLVTTLTYALCEQASADTLNLILGCSIDFRHNERIGFIERRNELIEKSLCPRVTMRLENHHQAALAYFFRRGQRGCNLRWMMTVVVDHQNAAGLSFALKSPVGALKLSQRKHHFFKTDFQLQTHGCRGKRIEHVVHSGHLKPDLAQQAAERLGSPAYAQDKPTRARTRQKRSRSVEKAVPVD